MSRRKLTAQEKLVELTALRIERDRTEQRIRDAVAMCRQPSLLGSPDASWAEIGAALGVTRQAAMQRYADGALRRAMAETRQQPAAKRRGARK